MELKQLQSFAAVVKYGSFTKAAEKLYISQPTISTHIRTLEEELVQRCIICTSPSKTFNLAGLLVSDIIIPNDQIRAAFQEKLAPYYLWPGNFGAAAQIAAYDQGEDWLEQLLVYLRGNAQYIGEFIAQRMPRVKYRPPEATYLA